MRTRLWCWLGSCVVLTMVASVSRADDPAEAKKLPPATPLDARAVAARIDAHFTARWAAGKVEPAPVADDAEFLRRVFLDVVGRIPSVTETREFLKDQQPDKRQRLVDKLLQSGGYTANFTNVWRSVWMPEANTNFISRFLMPSFDNWLRQSLARNLAYDEMIRELLTTPIGNDAGRLFNPGMQTGPPNPLAFYVTKELKPENLAASTSRMFLGVRLECAQCHNHPFAGWQRDQFWGLAAFFAGLQKQEQQGVVLPQREVFDKFELTLPNSEKTIQAKFLDGGDPEFRSRVSPRVTLADWVVSGDNAYFARAAVNRVWAHLFGTGLIEPVDDMLGSETTISNPELLDDLARQFVANKFDLRLLIRAITASQTYQRSSALTHKSQEDPYQFARMALKGLTAAQLFDSLVQATGYVEAKRDLSNPEKIINDNSPRGRFLDKFGNRMDKPADAQTSILQALALMNNQFMADATAVDRSETLAAVVDAPFLSTRQRIETLYLASLSRLPRAEEVERIDQFLARATLRARSDPKGVEQALADVFWALLNSSEFVLNH